MKSFVICLSLVAAAVAFTVEDGPCNPGDTKSVPGSCKDYKECDANGEWVPKNCLSCKNFDEVKGKCVWVWNSNCEQGTTTSAAPTTPSAAPTSSSSVTPTSGPTTKTSSPTPTSTSTQPSTTTPVPTCKDGDPKKGIPTDCTKYLECNTKTHLYETKSCGKSWFFSQKYFDTSSLDCITKNYTCEK